MHMGHWKKQAGRKPVREIERVKKHNLARQGSKDALAVAMALRPSGTTQKQIEAILGKPHRNKFRRLVDKGLAFNVEMPLSAGHKVYRLKLK